MKKPAIIILISSVVLLICCAVSIFLIYNYINSLNINTDVDITEEEDPEGTIDEGNDIFTESDRTERVCESIIRLSNEGALSSVSITDDSDENACFFNLGGSEYGLIDLASAFPEEEFNSLKTMYTDDIIEEVSLDGVVGAYWSTKGGLLIIWTPDSRIITINSSSNLLSDVVSVAEAYL